MEFDTAINDVKEKGVWDWRNALPKFPEFGEVCSCALLLSEAVKQLLGIYY